MAIIERSEFRKRIHLSRYIADPEDTEIFIPDDIDDINEQCFFNVDRIKKVTVNEKIRIIREGVFSNFESLEEIDLKNVTTVYAGAFFNCAKLKRIISKNKIDFLENSLMHCFSLKEVNALNPSFLEAYGDTSTFEYPLINKNLEVARLKIDYDLTKVKNGEDFVNNWKDIFLARHVREVIFFKDGIPTISFNDTFKSSKELEEYLDVIVPLNKEVNKMPCVAYPSALLPRISIYEDMIPSFLREMDAYGYDINSLDHFKPGKLDNLSDVVNHLSFLVIKDEIVDYFYEALSAQDQKEAKEYTHQLMIRMRSYVDFAYKFCKMRGFNDYVPLFEEKLINSLEDFEDSVLVRKESQTAHYSCILAMLDNEDAYLLNKLEQEIDIECSAMLYTFLAEKILNYKGLDAKKYVDVSCHDFISVYNYSAIGLTGDMRHVRYFEVGLNAKKEEYLLSEMLKQRKKNLNEEIESLYDNLIIFHLGIKKYHFNELMKVGLCYNIDNTTFSRFLKEEVVIKPKEESQYMFEANNLYPTGFTIQVLFEDKVKEEFRGKLPYPQYALVYDIFNIIIDHDYDSFMYLYHLTENTPKDKIKSENSIYFPDFVQSPWTYKRSNCLSKEKFNTIDNVFAHIIF